MIAKYFYNYAKVAEFCRIWSHKLGHLQFDDIKKNECSFFD